MHGCLLKGASVKNILKEMNDRYKVVKLRESGGTE